MDDLDLKETDRKRKRVLLRLLLASSLLVEILLVILFFYLQFYGLMILAMFYSATFVFNFFLLKKEKFLLSLQVCVISIVTGSLIFSYFLGWTSYFGFYLVAAVIIVINSLSIKLGLKIFEVILVSLIFFLLWIFTKDGFHLYIVDIKILDLIGIINILLMISLTLFMQFQNFLVNEKLKKKLEEMSGIDMLTGAYNRRFFNKYLDIEIKRYESLIKYGQAKEVNFGIAMIDIDNFKRINDTYGHLIGDTVIASVAQIIKKILFERDIFCRYGGEEFVVLFTTTSRPGMMIAIGKILKTVRDYVFSLDDKSSGIQVTISIGFASFGEESDINKLLDLADKRLLAAKKAGKNRVVSD